MFNYNRIEAELLVIEIDGCMEGGGGISPKGTCFFEVALLIPLWAGSME
jgi:hypothetical protein